MGKINSNPAASAEPAGERIRVVRVIDRLNIGGPAKHVIWLTTGLDANEFDATLITGTVPCGEGDMGYFAEASGVRPVVIKEMSRELGLRDIVVVAKLFRQFLKIKPQIIHTHKAKAGAAGRIAAFIYKWLTPSAVMFRPRECRVLHTYHGHVFHSYYGTLKTWIFLTIERALARFCTDRLLVVSAQQSSEICKTFHIGRAEQFQVVPLGLDLDELADDRARVRDQLQLADDEVAIGIVGRLCEIKNHAMFLESAARVAEDPNGSHSRTRFVVVGDGHLRPSIEGLARELRVAEKTVFAGFRRDATSLYSGLDIVALTSLNEGTPLTLIEAMCSGRAVAATEVGGVVDLMGSRLESRVGFTVWEHGVTAASRDVEGFARALRYLIERPELRLKMGMGGQSFVRTRFSRRRLVNDIEQIYHELLSQKTGVAAGAAPRVVSLREKGNSL
jgi:glycosyltransferase involved in cell wall biosynthesis